MPTKKELKQIRQVKMIHELIELKITLESELEKQAMDARRRTAAQRAEDLAAANKKWEEVVSQSVFNPDISMRCSQMAIEAETELQTAELATERASKRVEVKERQLSEQRSRLAVYDRLESDTENELRHDRDVREYEVVEELAIRTKAGWS